MLLVCAESPTCGSRTWSVNVSITVLFGFFFALAISVKQKNPCALERKIYPNLGVHMTNDSTVLQLKASGRATLNSTENGLSAFWFSILESCAT